MKHIFLALLLTISFQPSVSLANKCAQVFEVAGKALSKAELIQKLALGNIPAVTKTTRNGEIPVILMNAETAAKVSELTDSSIGTVVAHQPNWNNDHGLFRLRDNFADMDLPGHRGRGELNANGLSWASVKGYLNYARGAQTSIRVEVAYSLSKAEMKVAELYHRMRRASIIRVQFTFNGAKQNTNLTNFLKGGGEHCFVFCSGGSLSSHIYEINSRFNEYGLGKIEDVLGLPDVSLWIGKVENSLLSADVNSARDLAPDVAIRNGLPDSLAQNQAFQNLSQDKKMEVLNWLVGYKFSKDYLKLTEELGFARDNAYASMNSKRATAVLIYDGNVSAESFKKPSYESKGIFSTWSHRDTKPIN